MSNILHATCNKTCVQRFYVHKIKRRKKTERGALGAFDSIYCNNRNHKKIARNHKIDSLVTQQNYNRTKMRLTTSMIYTTLL